jgi:farnesyl diphosphate synthase
MGKATGKDAGRGKGTLVGLHGMAWAEATLEAHVREAEALLRLMATAAAVLANAARFIAERKS